MLTFNFKSPWQQASLKHFETKWSYSLKKKKKKRHMSEHHRSIWWKGSTIIDIHPPSYTKQIMFCINFFKKNGVVLYPDENELFDILSYIAIKWLLITLNVAYSISVPVCIHWDRFIIISPSDLRTIMTFFSFTWFVSK